MTEKRRNPLKITIIISVFCILSFISFNCIENPLTPVAPMSDIILEGISMIDATKYFRDVEAKAKGTTINSDSTMSFITTQYAAPVSIDSMKMEMKPSGQKVGVGIFGIAALPSTNQNVTLGQMGLSPVDYPGANSTLPGVPPPFPASYVSRPGDTLNFSSQFDYAAINSGSLSLQLVNNLPLRLSFNKPIVLRNNQLTPVLDTSWIAVFVPGTIDSFATFSSTQSIAGKIMRAQMKFDSISFTTQSRSTPFSLKSTHGISIQFASSALTADSAQAVIPPQTLTSINDSSVVVDDSVVINDAAFSAGAFQLRLVNNLGIEVGARFIINEFIQSGSSFTIDTVLQPKTTTFWTITGSQLRIQPLASTLGTKLTYSVGITTIDSKGAKKPITKNDTVSASIIPVSPLVVKSITGKIKTQILALNSMSATGLDFKDVKNLTVDSIRFKGVNLTLRFPMTGGYPMDYDFTVIAKLNGKSIDSLKIKTGQNGFTRIYPSNPRIPLANAPNFDRFISNFIPIAPDSFYITGSVTLNPDFADLATQSYSTYDTSHIYPEYDVDFPCSVGIANGVLRDVVGFTRDQVPKGFTKAIKNGTIAFNFVNMIPLQLSFQGTFRGNYSIQNPKGDSLFTLKPSDLIRAGQINTTTGYSSAPTVSRVAVTLNGSQMEMFNQADSLAIEFGISTSNNGQVVKVRAQDYIRIYAKGDIVYTVNKQ